MSTPDRAAQAAGSAAVDRGGPSVLPWPVAALRAEWSVAVLLGLAGVVVSWLRLDAISRATLWAEDGAVFLQSVLDGDGNPLAPYTGYLHVVPRLIALVAAVLPLELAARVFAFACCVIVGLVTAIVYRCARDVVFWRPARIAVAALTFLAPVAAYEVLGNAANVHWYLLWLAPWLLLARPRRWASAWLLAVVGCLAALTEIQVALFLPLLAWRAREPRRWLVGAGVALGVAGQLVATVLSPRQPGADEQSFPSIVLGYLVHGPMAALFPTRQLMGDHLAAAGWWGAAVILLPFVVAVVVAVRRGAAVERIAAVTFAVASVVLWTAAFVVNSNPDRFASEFPVDQVVEFTFQPRYAMAPSLFLLATIVLGTSVAHRAGRFRRTAGVVLAVLMVLMCAISAVPHQSAATGAVPWSPQVERARERCAAPLAPETLHLAIAPAPWTVVLPCERLAS